MDIRLSSDSDALICVLYAEYLSRRKHGIPIEDASYFKDDYSVHDTFLPQWLQEDVTTVCFWLEARGLISCLTGDDHCLDISLTEDGIVYMEARFEKKHNTVIAHLKELIEFGVPIALNLLH